MTGMSVGGAPAPGRRSHHRHPCRHPPHRRPASSPRPRLRNGGAGRWARPFRPGPGGGAVRRRTAPLRGCSSHLGRPSSTGTVKGGEKTCHWGVEPPTRYIFPDLRHHSGTFCLPTPLTVLAGTLDSPQQGMQHGPRSDAPGYPTISPLAAPNPYHHLAEHGDNSIAGARALP